MKRDSADFEINFLFWASIVVMGISLLGLFFDGYNREIWIILLLCGLMSMIVIKVIRGFHNVLLDIRDALMNSPPKNMKQEEIVYSNSRVSALQNWKAEQIQIIENSVKCKIIPDNVGATMIESVNSSVEINNDLTLNLFDDSGVPTYVIKQKQEERLDEWKTNYIARVNQALSAGNITQEKAEAIIKKVQNCTEIPEGQK